ncbi:MAG TPA: bifunctional enoyl-CoA hydratase/phosphate acetyltransferase [Firmicutes bacterium]|nr:bifunctional enoyl-CoA hydratase/phosphate acetyltransferase [Bacillota bacterium]
MTPRLRNLVDSAKRHAPVRIAVAGAEYTEVLEACAWAVREGLAEPIFFGNATKVNELWSQISPESSAFEIRHSANVKEACAGAVEAVRVGEAGILMKGLLQTADIMRAALDPDKGLRTGRLLTHVAAIELPCINRLFLLSDGGLVPAPTFPEKAEIVRNAVFAARAFGLENPKVAILAAVETISEAMTAAVHAACLKVMAERGQITGCVVDGPLSLDAAISPEAAKHKKIAGPVAGSADILIVPDIEAGNVLAKSMTFIAGGLMAGIVVGARAPIVITSRADPPASKLASIAFAAAVSRL